MARVNVEDDWWTDKTRRRAALIRAVANRPRDPEREADGLALDAWTTAQRYWKEGQSLIPEDVWQLGGFEPLIEAKLAERRPEGIYVSGTKEHHDWLYQKIEAAKKGGEARKDAPRDEHGRFQPSLGSEPATGWTPPADIPAIVQPATTPPAPALALAPSQEKKTSSSSSPEVAAKNIRALAELWNAKKSPKQAKVNLKLLKPSQDRWKAAKARLAEFPDLAYWQTVIESIAGNDWCNGKNDRKWVADFVYLVRPETHVKATEGEYPFKAKPKSQQQTMKVFSSEGDFA
jgi:hypothetical protein